MQFINARMGLFTVGKSDMRDAFGLRVDINRRIAVAKQLDLATRRMVDKESV